MAPGLKKVMRVQMIGVGVDFGTSNSTAAWFDGDRLHFVRLEQGSAVLPSAIHLDREFATLTGAAAIHRYVEENRGRRVELVAEVIGERASSVGGAGPGHDIDTLETRRDLIYGPLTDRGQPGRLFHGLKRLLGDGELHRLAVFDRAFRLVALITPILLRIRRCIEQELGRPVQRVHLGRPVNFEGRQSTRNEVAVERLAEAATHAGLPDLQFFPEPVAATLSYLWREPPVLPGVALTVDFGGGTLDLSMVRFSKGQFDVLGTAGVGLGGDRIDQLIYEQILFPLLGKGESWSRWVEGSLVTTLFPFEQYETALLNWPITHTLNQNRTKTMVLDRLEQGGPAKEKFERLNDLVNFNYSYNCFQAIKIAKAALSEVEATHIDIPELNLRVPFTRAQLDAILVPGLATLEQLMGDLLTRVGVAAPEVGLVIRTGGSSQIVAVRRLLERHFPGRVVAHDPFTSVAGGLAIASYRELSAP